MSEACGRAKYSILYNIVHYTDKAIGMSILLRHYLTRTCNMLQAKESVHVARYTELWAQRMQMRRELYEVQHAGVL